MIIKLYTILAPIFLGLGIGILISPAFTPDLAGWNVFGFLFVGIGFYFTGKVYEN